jgi:nucleotide-binding universal stress UspA family protein
MSIKRILVHFGHHEHLGHGRLDAGITLARRYDAQLHGLFVIDAAAVPGAIQGRGASMAYLSEAIELLKEKAGEIGAEFKDRCEREQISWNWTCVEGNTLEVLKEHSFCADITIVGQQDSGGLDDVISLHRSDFLPLLSPGPVLILPKAGKTAVSAEYVLVAWKPDRSCARAVRDALPILTRAKSVTLLTVDPPSDWNLPDTAIGDYLAAHGVQLMLETRESGTFEGVCDVILRVAKDLGSDMLVMGAHGQSRLAELIFGGATHDMLRKMQIPVLMSH